MSPRRERRAGLGRGFCPRLVAAIAGALALLAPASAGAQATHEVDAFDDFWAPEEVTAEPGDTVRWSFDQAVANNHNVFVRPPGGTATLLSSAQVPPGSAETAEYVVPAADGIYDYYCSLHGSPAGGMNGVIQVGGTGPGPVGPQPLPNPSDPIGVFEEGDNVRPELGRVRIDGVRHGVRVRFALSEPGRLEVTISGNGERLRERFKGLTAGRHTERVRERTLEPGSYRVTARAADQAGNRSGAARARVRIKG